MREEKKKKKDEKREEDIPEVGGTTGFGMPFNACGSCPALTCASAAIGLMYVPCAVAAAMRAACCCK